MAAATSLDCVDDVPIILALAHGVHADVPERVYHARCRALASKSTLDMVRRAPSKLAAYMAGAVKPPTEAMVFGSLFHAALLEPERYEREYTITPAFGDLRAVAGRTSKEEGAANKAARAAWLASHQGLKFVDADDHAAIVGMVASARRHPLVEPMLDSSMREATIRWRDPATGVECKSRADALQRKLGICLDAKTCDDASPDGFIRSVENFGYARQAAMYLDGLAAAGEECAAFRFLAIEKDPPYDCAVYDLSDESLAVGREQIRRALETFAECLRTNTWPSYTTSTTTLSLRPWALKAA